MDSDLETPRHEMDFNDTNMSHSLEIGKYHQDDPYLQVTVILFDKFYLLLQVKFPIQKWPYFSQFWVYFPRYNEKSIYLFPNVKAQVASQNRR